MTATIISVSIGVAGFIITVLAKLFSVSSKYGALMETVKRNEERDREEREKTRNKFGDIYSKLNGHDTVLAKLQTDVSNINSILVRLEGKLDRLIESKSNN